MSDKPYVSAGKAALPLKLPLRLVGLMERPQADSVNDPLEINAILLRSGPTAVLLLSVDCLYVDSSLKSEIRRRLADVLDLDDAHILMAATHTHRAPAMESTKAFVGPVNADFASAVVETAVQLAKRLAVQSPVECTVRYGSGKADHSINRRRRVFDPRTMRSSVRCVPNEGGLRHEEIAAVSLSDGGGNLLAVLWDYACHPVGRVFGAQVSADYPGIVRQHLRQRLGAPELPVLFYQGFAGDIRPNSLDKSKGLVARIKRRLYGSLFADFNHEDFNRWADSLADRVGSAIASAEQRPCGGLDASLATLGLAELIDGAPPGRTVSFQCVTIGPTLALVGISAEVVAEYDEMVRQLLPTYTVIPISCIDSTFGYLPTQAILDEGGYEANGFLKTFGIEGRFRDHPERKVLGALRSAIPSSASHKV